MEPIHKLNNGIGATICNKCSVIITEGLTRDLYCEKCLNCIEYKNLTKNLKRKKYDNR
jgi:hypothetical protein